MARRPQLMVIMDAGLQRSPALLRALSLARRMDAALALRSFEYSRSLAQAAKRGFDLEAYLEGRQRRLEDLAAHLRREGAQVDAKVVWGGPLLEQILFDVLALSPAIVVKDVRPHTDPARAFLNGIDWRLLAECPAPLMLVQPGAASLPLRLVAAVDPLDEHGKPHELNDQILDAATSLAAQCGAELDVVNAFEYIPPAGEWEYVGWMPDLTLYGELRQLHAEGLYQLGKQHGVPPSRMHILDGDAATAISGFARQRRAELVVMGSMYRSGLKRLMLGSTAEGVFDTLGCDVLLLKPRGFAAELQRRLETGEAKVA